MILTDLVKMYRLFCEGGRIIEAMSSKKVLAIPRNCIVSRANVKHADAVFYA